MACGDPLGTYYAHVTQVIKNKHVPDPLCTCQNMGVTHQTTICMAGLAAWKRVHHGLHMVSTDG